MALHLVVEYSGIPRAVLRVIDDFGFQSYDLVAPPRRLLPAEDATPLLEANVDGRRVSPLDPVSGVLQGLPAGESWLNVSWRTLARLFAAYLVSEDPQRRLDAHKAATLMHQVSLVQHLLTSPNLKRALVADEVGLGKTIEAGLIVKRLVAERPALRVLYLAPARLVGNVVREFREKLDLDARQWVAGTDADARLESDRIVVASINKAVFGDNFERVTASGPWDVLIVDECHHLSDWDPDGGKPNQGFKLVSQLARDLPADGRLVLMSGTPHQGSEARFKNILRLLSDDGKDMRGAAGRVIYRTKDRARDWEGKPLFPSREIRQPTVVQLGNDYERWYQSVGALYDQPGRQGSKARAAGWAKGQALQWAASSVQAGLGFLVRLAMRRLGWTLENDAMASALAALRPYRGGSPTEPLPSLYDRIMRQVKPQALSQLPEDDLEEWDEDEWRPDSAALEQLLRDAVALLRTPAATGKWQAVARLIDAAEDEKVVLFAQPVETVTVVANFLLQRYGQAPSLIIGNQSENERQEQVSKFQSEHGPRFLVSSRAGGEGLNMQRARRLIHLDVPWNPMELEQRIGRIHRFGSRKTVLVDTVVAAGSREVDMYRIAREKLALIATHLDPDQFETLFGRVMSLVPPKELEEILGGTVGVPFPDAATNEIGRLVAEGYESWSAFDKTYRSQADAIRMINPGEATWQDLGSYLAKFGSASSPGEVSVTAFEFQDEEIFAIEGKLPSVVLGEKLYVCGDTGGLQAEAPDGRPVHQLGLNVPVVAELLRSSFVSQKPTGMAYLKRAPDLAFLGGGKEPVAVVVLQRQSLRQELGRSSEHTVSLHMYAVQSSGSRRELTPKERASVVRGTLSATRTKDPNPELLRQEIAGVIGSLAVDLKRPTSEDITLGIRHAVWPIAALVFH